MADQTTTLVRINAPAVRLVRMITPAVRLIRPAAGPIRIMATRQRAATSADPAGSLLLATEAVVVSRVMAMVGGHPVYYDCREAGHLHGLVGIALNSAGVGQSFQIQASGIVRIPGWGLIPDQVYRAGINGHLAAVPPEDARFVQVLGRAISEYEFNFSPNNPTVKWLRSM